MKYKNWLDEWIACHVRPVTKTGTCEKYRKQADTYIVPYLGECELGELTASDLQRFAASVMQKGLAANTVNGILSVLRASLRRAVLFGLTDTQCSDAIVRPKHSEKQIECFTLSEQRKIERYIAKKKNDRLYGIVLSLYTGLRIGELLALTWQDIDFGKGVLTVHKTCRDGWRNGAYVKETDTPKTANGYRVMPVPEQLLAQLEAMKDRAAGEYVVAGRSAYGAQVRSYQRTFANVLKCAGVPHKGFHALRHTFATRALEVGMDVKTLSELLGHGDPTVTLKRYAHSMLEHKTEMMNRVGRLLLP